MGASTTGGPQFSEAQNTSAPQGQLTWLFNQSQLMVTTDKEVQTVENASGAVSTMPTSSLISNSNSVTDDSDEDDYASDEDYDYENNPMADFEFDTKLDYFDRATGAFSEFLNQDR